MAIVIAVFIVLGVTAGNDWSKERKFKKLMLLQSDKKVRVVRVGIKNEISSWDIVVGDLVELVGHQQRGHLFAQQGEYLGVSLVEHASFDHKQHQIDITATFMPFLT